MNMRSNQKQICVKIHTIINNIQMIFKVILVQTRSYTGVYIYTVKEKYVGQGHTDIQDHSCINTAKVIHCTYTKYIVIHIC